MTRFDIYINQGKGQKSTPYLLDIQSNVISGLATRIVIPLRLLDAFAALNVPPDLCPMIPVQGVNYFLDTPQLAAIPFSELKNKVTSCQEYQFKILTALDRVFGTH